MAILKDILYGVSLVALEGQRDREVSGVAFDSRKVNDGVAFVAVKGLQVDGHDFIDQAVASGASAVVCETLPESRLDQVTYVQVNNSAQALGLIASNFYGRPSEHLHLVGVTGTNGKTTVATLLYELFSELGNNTGLLSTVNNRIGEDILPSQYTTADAVSINELLSQMVAAGCTHCFMEVSSHALAQYRTAGLQFKGGIFTNLSHDHLDYHGSVDNYIKAKKMLFDGLSADAFALVNADDRRGAIMLQNTAAAPYRYGVKSMATFKGRLLSQSLMGMEVDIDQTPTWFKLIGTFNLYNLLAAYGVGVLLEESPEEVLKALSNLKGAAGRMEQVPNQAQVLALVDYAHTPDALENVLKTITELRTNDEMLITVVGCGGDRDQTKRAKMAAIASAWSNKVILTSDNPRTEDPAAIIDDMQKGIKKSKERDVMAIVDRREAIRVACNLVQANDILLVAGKGHETYQEVNGVRHPFDDREILKEMLDN